MDYILGLDISTSVIGVSLFKDLGDKGEIEVITHVDLNKKEVTKGVDTKLESLLAKGEYFINVISEFKGEYNITKIVVEEPFKYSSNSPVVGGMLIMFNEYISDKVSKLFGVEIDFISVHDAREFGLPELMGKRDKKSKKDALFAPFPMKIGGVSLSKYKKMIVMYQLAKRFPEIQWGLNSVLNIDNKNFDRADY